LKLFPFLEIWQMFSETRNTRQKYFYFSHLYKNTPKKRWIQLHKSLPGFLFRIFSSLICSKKPVFSKGDLLQWKVPASLSLFLKCEKIPALLYLEKGPEQ
jgi:hypothetical protein